jgi:protein-disulfide isomerase
MRAYRALITIATFTLILPISASDPITAKQGEDILTELRKIRALLERDRPRPALDAEPARIAVQTKGAPSLGSKDAPLTIVEFMDYQCPYCRQFQSGAFPSLKRIYLDTGKVRFYAMDFPLDIHPQALLAARAARCAAEQNNFWPMHDHMQSETEVLTTAKILELAGKSGLDANRFRVCLESGKYEDEIRQDVASATAKGIHATPTFIVGKSTAGGVEGEVVVGAVPLGILQQKIESLTK